MDQKLDRTPLIIIPFEAPVIMPQTQAYYSNIQEQNQALSITRPPALPRKRQ